MTEITFHFNVPDKLEYACKLLRKATRSGARVVVTGEAGLLGELDTALWTFSPLEFIAHCHVSHADARVVAASPVLLAESTRGTPHQEVLVNLGGALPEGFERFERLNELVSQDEEDRAQARARWKHYTHRGYAMNRHDVVAREGG
jgi:DNA polymerase-3 subunit chi